MTDVASYREQGFALCKGLFAVDEVERIHAEAKAVFAAQMQRYDLLPDNDDESEFATAMFKLFELDLPAFTNCGKQAQHLISLHRLSLDDRILTELRALGLEAPNISTRPVLYFNHERLAKKEVYWRLRLHQDWRSIQGSLDSVVVWLPLVDIDKSLGALEIIPGSHRWGLLAADLIDGYGNIASEVAEQLDVSQLTSVEVERGDALFFSTFLVHQSGTNVTDRLRWSCHFRYNNLSEPTFVARGFPHPYLYRPEPELITADFPSTAQVGRVFSSNNHEE